MRKRKIRSRGWKAARNFVLLAVVLFGCWAGIRSPLWMMEYELRRDAQEEFEILWKGSLSGGVCGSNSVKGEKPMVVAQVDGMIRGRVLSMYEGGYSFYGFSRVLPVEQGTPKVISSYELVGFVTSYDGGQYLFAAELPDDATMGEITVTTTEGVTYTAFGYRDMDVIWFPIKLNSGQYYNELVNACYMLDLYDEEGTLLSRTQGLIHEQKEEAA